MASDVWKRKDVAFWGRHWRNNKNWPGWSLLRMNQNQVLMIHIKESSDISKSEPMSEMKRELPNLIEISKSVLTKEKSLSSVYVWGRDWILKLGLFSLICWIRSTHIYAQILTLSLSFYLLFKSIIIYSKNSVIPTKRFYKNYGLWRGQCQKRGAIIQ